MPKAEWSLRWYTPYSEPPEGLPRVLAFEITEGSERPLNLYKMSPPGGGYMVCWSLIDEREPRRLSEAAKQNLRRKSLVRRVVAKAPLFLEEIVSRELSSQPDYFGQPPSQPTT